jgi:hypothetical protein
MAPKDRERLWQRALELELARPEDFAAGRRAPTDAAAEHLRVIADTGLRTRLIEARIAEGLQSPKGPQKLKSIVRLYPGFDAPGRNGPAPRKHAVSRVGLSPRAPAARDDRPTLEEMRALLEHLHRIETAVSQELHAGLDDRLRALQSELASASDDDLERLHAELGRTLETRRALRSKIRNEAFARIERELDARGRAYLRLLSPR